MTYIVAALYKFVRFADPASIRVPLLQICAQNDVRGTLLLADEGINGTIAGSRAGIDLVLTSIRELPGCADLEHKESTAQAQPFRRMKVRIKSEIVTLGQGPVDPASVVGTYVEPEDWNDLISREDVAVIDTRNDYEVAIGSFDRAVDPETASFREFPAWWDANKGRFEGKKVAMFCTGGIRCEKSTSWLKSQGVEDVYHLRGGILKYLENVPERDSLWHGDCFVFDERVSVRHGLAEGDYMLCHACRRPLTKVDLDHAAYRRGVSCHHCIGEYSDADRARFAERQRQIDLAKARGDTHLATGPSGG
ncbi:MAG: rhodanese-related sulfurtransferase [Pseudomonadota bacterium]